MILGEQPGTITERPILFSAPMVRAILEGRKTQTRKLIQPQPQGLIRTTGAEMPAVIEKAGSFYAYDTNSAYSSHDTQYKLLKCPYGKPGDRLWVKETWFQGYATVYCADHPTLPPSGNPADKWRISRFMPRWASRITLVITEIRAEQLQTISEPDAEAEGCQRTWRQVRYDDGSLSREEEPVTAREAFQDLWNRINGKANPWGANPWVWAISFEVVR